VAAASAPMAVFLSMVVIEPSPLTHAAAAAINFVFDNRAFGLNPT
jgi:hypothetical protein